MQSCPTSPHSQRQSTRDVLVSSQARAALRYCRHLTVRRDAVDPRCLGDLSRHLEMTYRPLGGMGDLGAHLQHLRQRSLRLREPERRLLDGLYPDALALLQEHVQFHFDVLIKGPIVLITLKA